MTGNVSEKAQTGDVAGSDPQGRGTPGGPAASDPEDDRKQMERIAGGDHTEAVGALYDTYATQIYGLGRRYLGDHGGAEDLVQETFVRLWRHADRYDPAKGSVRTFVFTIARRVAIDLNRRAAARPASAGSGFEPREQVDAASHLGFDRALLAIDLDGAVSRLPEAQRQVIHLTFLSDMTQSQIATKLNVPLGTVKSRTHHAMRALRTTLEDDVPRS